MVTSRRTAIAAIAITAVLAVPFLLSWLSNIDVPHTNPWPWLVPRVQFEEGYLNVTMTNNDNRDYIISEVLLSNRAGTILAGKLGPEPISVGEQISICINFNWTSSYYYDIIVRTADSKSSSCGVYAP